MKSVTVTTTAEKVADAGCDMVAIKALSTNAQIVYLKFDGDATALTSSNGFPLSAGETLVVNNDGNKDIAREIWAVTNAATAVIRIQGED